MEIDHEKDAFKGWGSKRVTLVPVITWAKESAGDADGFFACESYRQWRFQLEDPSSAFLPFQSSGSEGLVIWVGRLCLDPDVRCLFGDLRCFIDLNAEVSHG
jgi:hypothetical protein